jgi:CheY-like chemotaxis protein
LGLSTAHGIVQQAGGWIAVKSSPGEGATFEVYLPQATGTEARRRTREHGIRERGGSETILVVEDQPSVRQFAAEVLRQLGYRIMEAGSGPDALELSASHEGTIDLVLTDIIMPGMNGLVLADRIRPERPLARILYMTAYAGNVLEERGVASEGLDCLQKPFRPSELARKVREVLDRQPKGPTILVVDDEAPVRRMLGVMLGGAGYAIVDAEDGAAALAVLARVPVDLMLADLVMPEKESLETIREARKRYPKLKIIAMSGSFGGQCRKADSPLAADAAVAKPVDYEELLSTIRNILASR